MEIELTPNYPYSFKETVFSHGWVSLPPFYWDSMHETLERIERLRTGKVVKLHLKEISKPPHSSEIKLNVENGKNLTQTEEKEIVDKVRWMLRLDEDLSEFYDLCTENETLSWLVESGAGRILRSSNLFEDTVKVIITTNANWSQTIAMVTGLVEKLGSASSGDSKYRAFPTPEDIIGAGIKSLKTEIKMGYRSDIVFEISQNEWDELNDLEKFQHDRINSEELRQRFLKLKGIGPYAACHLLVFLGHYDRLGVDTEMRSFVSEKYFQGRRVTDKEIFKVYQKWGKWKYLVYWAEKKKGV